MVEPLTGAVVSVLVNQVYAVLENENQALRGFREVFERTRKKIHLITSLLGDLQRKNEDYNTIKAILVDIRELVYDADDILLECQIRAAHEEISIFHGRTPRGWSFRSNAANKLKQIQERIEEIEEKNLKAYLPAVGQMIQRQASEEGSSQGGKRTHVRGQSKMIGLEEDARKIIGWVTAKEKSRCIEILGMGGMGKTTIAQAIFDNQQVVDHFHERIWVTFSQVFSQKDILKSMMMQLRVDAAVPINNNEMFLIQQALQNKNYLIVMDDIWDIDLEWWRLLSSYLPEGEKCSKRIIITTRNKNVATNMGAVFRHETRKLNSEESWSLFCEFAFDSFDSKKKRRDDKKFQELGEEIVDKCEGFPLAIKTIAGLLSSKTSLHQWQEVSTNFRDEMNNNTSVSATLQLSYDDLPAKLKHCLLSFSIYPEDCDINAEQLVYWWVGEGFVNGNGKRSAIEEAFECLLELVNRCLVAVKKQRRYDGRVYICKMHDMVRDMVIKMAKEEVFSSFDTNNKQIADRNSRHMGYTSEMKEGFKENNPKVRAFLLMENCELPLQKGAGLASVESLRVLDLSKNEQETMSCADLWRWIKSQKRLAYLHLKKVADLKKVPKWIKERHNLQILVLSECNNLERLPSSITDLQNLIVLNVESCPLQKLPKGLGKLTKLQILYGFKMASSRKDGARLDDLMLLKELRELGIILSKNDEIGDDEEDVLSKLQQLKVLIIDTKDKECGQKQIKVVDKLVPPRSLQELYLRSYHGETMPSWVSPSVIPKLRYLSIDQAQLTGVGPAFWGDGETEWIIEGLCFKHLLRFKLDYKTVKERMKYLRYVEVSHCLGLDTFPCDVNNYDIWEREEDDEWKLQDGEEEH